MTSALINLAFLLAGAWLTYRAQRGQSPLPLTEWPWPNKPDDQKPKRREPMGSV